jgi:hypothetical protein
VRVHLINLARNPERLAKFKAVDATLATSRASLRSMARSSTLLSAAVIEQRVDEEIELIGRDCRHRSQDDRKISEDVEGA